MHSLEWRHCTVTFNPNSFYVTFLIFVVGEHRDFKFGMRVDHNKSQPTDDKLLLKGAWSRHLTLLKIFSPLKISLERLKLGTSNIDSF